MNKQKAWTLLNRFGMSVTLILLGLILIVCPDSASILLSRLMGWLLTAAGVLTGVFALLSREKRVSRFVWAAAELLIGSVLNASPLLLARNIGRFLGVLLAIEGGECLRTGRKTFGIILLAAALGLIFAPMAASRLVFTACGIIVTGIGIAMFADRWKHGNYLNEGDDPNIIDAL